MSDTKPEEADEDFSTTMKLFMQETRKSLKTLNENTDKNAKEIKDSIKDLKTNITSNTNKIANIETKITKFESKINSVEKNLSDDINTIKKRLDTIESQAEKVKTPYADALKSPPKKDENTPTIHSEKYTKPSSSHTNAQNQAPSHTDIKRDTLNEAKKIIGIAPITKSDLNHVANTHQCTTNEEVLKMAAMDFLQYELKMTTDEINALGVTKITRPKKEDTEKMYLDCHDHKTAHYIFRKGAQVSNQEIKISPFIHFTTVI